MEVAESVFPGDSGLVPRRGHLHRRILQGGRQADFLSRGFAERPRASLQLEPRGQYATGHRHSERRHDQGSGVQGADPRRGRIQRCEKKEVIAYYAGLATREAITRSSVDRFLLVFVYPSETPSTPPVMVHRGTAMKNQRWISRFAIVVLLAAMLGAHSVRATTYLSAEPIPSVDVVGQDALAAILGAGYPNLEQWSNRLLNDCGIVQRVIDVLASHGAI